MQKISALTTLILCTTSMGSAQTSERVALCFWGLNRALNKTIASVEKMLLGPLSRVYTVDVFFHTYTIQTSNSVWAGEKNIRLQQPADELSLLNGAAGSRVRLWAAEAQELFDIQTDYTPYMDWNRNASGHHKYDEEGVVRDIIRGLNSLRSVSQLWMTESMRHHGQDLGHLAPKAAGSIGTIQVSTRRLDYGARPDYYKWVIYSRPDLIYVSPIDISTLCQLKPNQLLTPDWGCWLGGLNDRFAAGSPRAAAAFGLRLEILPNLTRSRKHRNRGVHTESLVRTALEHAHIQPVFSPGPCGYRTRANGNVKTRDCERNGKAICPK